MLYVRTMDSLTNGIRTRVSRRIAHENFAAAA